ncbi:hypothetical protein CIRMBP1229_02406 [Enterococcus cecorum]|uniref:DUF859 family phage minor structural protein n=1 Tax=Enterococcus cecorum TaxID=44008 RepID=UPI0022D89616|nr:DUF859 family phage minor structural protein [Enterococcus cecorum]CAI3327997.1 hypothetical protein CIRMBP1228_00956 [Enterococcus cecorum]CAI3469147.1 hypothetical protein CIRMBP1216_02170 [Enterococcus cecorum]CAI3474035.1 hypothetical protein CIRMBP1218_02158 [Enterococcus cecorum]CAI3474692.1 hypothetical protein CIRMBP1211_02218 [Enterococcus cecorum]CAI3475617.1 hypothetical protein CIRMBP1260_02230 [Enterococcus cecorum]
MALSGSQSINIHGGAHTLIVEWSASQNIGGNYSTVTANLYIKGNYSYSTIYSGSVAKSVAIVINGNRKNGSARIDINGTEKRLLLSHSVNVGHNADGTKAFRVEGMLNSQITWSGTYYGSEQWTRQDWSLNAIPRASTFNQSSTTFNMDSEGTIYINPASTSFNHKLYMYFGNKKVLLRDNAPVNQNFNVRFNASDFGDQIPNATSGVGVLLLETYNGGNLVGSNQRTTYLNLPSNYVPSQPSVTVSDESSVPAKLGVSKTAGIYVKGMSLLRFNSSASGVLGSTIINYKVQIGNQTFATGSSTIDADLSKFDVGTGSLNAVVTVTDSRGRTNSRTVSLNIQNYSAPTINNFSAVRQNNSDTVIITKPVSVSSILNGSTNINSYTVKTEYKLSTATSWTVNRTETNSSATLNLSGFNVANSYDIRVTLADKLNQTVVQASISTAKVLLDLNRDIGVGIGKMHERGALDVGGDMYVSGTLDSTTINGRAIKQNGRTLLDMFYPVGSIFITTVNTNPSSYMGGSWVRFGNGQTLVGVNESDTDFNTVQKTGGSKSHTIDYSNFPARATIQKSWKGGTVSYAPWQGGNVSAGTWIVSTPYDMGESYGRAISNLQPYITVYMWRRTA